MPRKSSTQLTPRTLPDSALWYSYRKREYGENWYVKLELQNLYLEYNKLIFVSAIISVYDKTGLLDLAKGLIKNNVRLLASGGTARMIRESGFAVE